VDYSHLDDGDQPLSGLAENGGRLVGLIVRVLGALLLVVGLLVALKVISEAWSLYRHPQGIEPLVVAIERGSGLDRVMAPHDRERRMARPHEGIPPTSGERKQAPADGVEAGSMVNADDFRLAYFPAWFIAILMLLLIGRLAIAAIHTGGQLALYDARILRLIRALERSRR